MEHADTAIGTHSVSRYRPLLFLIVFPAVYGCLHFLYFALPDSLLRDGVHYYAIVLPAATLLNLLVPHEAVSALHGSLQSAKASLDIVRGCDGAGAMFLLVAALIASSADIRHKLLGILYAVVLIYVLNELRVIALYFVVAYRSDWFGPLHNYFVPMLVIAASVLFFLWWTSSARESQVAGRDPDAIPLS
jgi:exosortase family protein XrtM